MQHFELIQNYLSNLGVLLVKWHNIHWNVVGKHFMKVHKYTEELYDQIFEDFDEIAELLKMKGVMPLSTMKEYLENATIKEVYARNFSREEALELVKDDLESMRKLGTEIRNIADEDGDFETVSLFEDYVSDCSKNIWFIDAMLK